MNFNFKLAAISCAFCVKYIVSLFVRLCFCITLLLYWLCPYTCSSKCKAIVCCLRCLSLPHDVIPKTACNWKAAIS